MTEIEVYGEDVDYEARKKYAEAISDNFDIMGELATIGDDFIAFGNSFTSLYIPFERLLFCPMCGFSAPIMRFITDSDLKWQGGEFVGTCPIESCRSRVKYTVKDVPKAEEQVKPRIVRWPPQLMQIKENPISGTKKYLLDVPRYQQLVEGVRIGDPLYLTETPWEFIVAVHKNEPLEFNEDQIYHMVQSQSAVTQPALRGWGLPLFMNEFETAVLVNLLDKYTEVIAVDYLIPFRCLSPPARKGTAEDPLLTIDMGGFMSHVRRMIDEHRTNPASWHTLPFPLQYQMLGGEANQLIPVEILEFFEHRLLSSMGIPAELQSGSGGQGKANALPLINFKLFEREWQFFANQLNKWLTWLTARQGKLLSWESVKARVIPVTIYEDPEVRAIKLQLAGAKIISNTTALRAYSMDYDYERRRRIEEESEDAKLMEEQQKEMEEKGINQQAIQQPPAGAQMLAEEEAAAQQAAGGMPGAPGGGMPMPGGPVAPAAPMSMGATLDDLMVQADQVAQQLLTADELTRRRTLGELKSSNEALYAQVKSRLAQMEQDAKQQGVQAVRQGALPMAPV